jgi:hypothetical protein
MLQRTIGKFSSFRSYWYVIGYSASYAAFVWCLLYGQTRQLPRHYSVRSALCTAIPSSGWTCGNASNRLRCGRLPLRLVTPQLGQTCQMSSHKSIRALPDNWSSRTPK